jgi:NADP-dependent 3-hydroxy acid dehydrogenase YdfG
LFCIAKEEFEMGAQTDFPKPPFKPQRQPVPGSSSAMEPEPDYGETTYTGSGRLQGKKAVITGGDSGIGRAVALAFAREGADVLIGYLSEEADAKETHRLVQESGRTCVTFRGDISKPDVCRSLVRKAVETFGRIDVLVNNAAHQMSFASIEEIADEEWDVTFATNISAMFYITKAAQAHMGPGSSIINTTSVNLDKPSPRLLAYAATKGAIQDLRSSWPRRASGRTPSRPVPSGRRSSQRPCRRKPSSISGSRCR